MYFFSFLLLLLLLLLPFLFFSASFLKFSFFSIRNERLDLFLSPSRLVAFLSISIQYNECQTLEQIRSSNGVSISW